MAKDSTGETVYLGATEIHRTAAGVVSCTRYYAYAGKPVGVRTDPGGLIWQAFDNHGTAELTISAATKAVVSRLRTDPFGNPRNSSPWPASHGFVNGVSDPTGLTHLGAREYDPGTGRFLSADPILETGDPRQLGGYAYAGNNPTTSSDPDGRCVRIEDLSGPCASAVNTSVGQRRLAQVEQNQRRQADNWARYRAARRAQQRFNRRTNERAIQTAALYEDLARAEKHAASQFNRMTGEDRTQAAALAQNRVTQAMNRGSSWWDAAIGATIVLSAVVDVVDLIQPEFEPLLLAGEGDLLATEMAERDAVATSEVETAGAKCSFDEHTPVVMADGTSTPISHVKRGDIVMATDPATGQTTAQTVTALHVNNDTDLADLTITQPNHHTTVLHTTQNHPFWDLTRHQWVNAGQLRPGDQLQPRQPATITVTAIHPYTQPHTMYNLTVDNVHTYYVIVDDTAVLVHNCGGARFAVDSDGVASDLQPLGRGSTGRTVPNHLNEQLAMQQAMSDPAAGSQLRITLTDPRWPAQDGWVKMSQNINGTEIHYVRNTITGQIDDFKFK